jgi:hypothetical protein
MFGIENCDNKALLRLKTESASARAAVGGEARASGRGRVLIMGTYVLF